MTSLPPRAAIAATRSPRPARNGKLGPRLDTIDKDAEDNRESIVEPREEIDCGYPEQLMPADYGERLDDGRVQALAAFIATVSGGEAEGGDDGGKGRGRGRSGRG